MLRGLSNWTAIGLKTASYIYIITNPYKTKQNIRYVTQNTLEHKGPLRRQGEVFLLTTLSKWSDI
jgi:hypothetical protein